LNGSFTTTFTPLIVPVTTPRTSFTAVVLISPAPLSAPVAAASSWAQSRNAVSTA
jgi:hypothetical protein